ncbi:MAG: DUF1697 domain-containing protein [Dysgonamonadaceae bacterium]|jgi:uncharacterized protein (DUF1697 family)|nr:DUF1697 domain-containing protein [Dysgonamonadaceae bacterium]
MEKIKYIALLRGINVGGKNIIKMNELKTVFEELKFIEVKTYIQSGNIIFTDTDKDKTKLTEIIQKALFEKFNYDCPIRIYNFNEYQNIINNIPKGFGMEKEKYKYDVWFLINPLTAEEVMKSVRLRDGVDKMYKGSGVVYTSRLIEMLGKSYFSKTVQLPMYKNITIRNWNTTQRIVELMEEQCNENKEHSKQTK